MDQTTKADLSTARVSLCFERFYACSGPDRKPDKLTPKLLQVIEIVKLALLKSSCFTGKTVAWYSGTEIRLNDLPGHHGRPSGVSRSRQPVPADESCSDGGRRSTAGAAEEQRRKDSEFRVPIPRDA